jgi:hypothetical protein
MSEQSETPKTATTSKASATPKPAPDESTGRPDEAPGPITPAHESGSTEQTLAAAEAREALRKAQGGGETDEDLAAMNRPTGLQ